MDFINFILAVIIEMSFRKIDIDSSNSLTSALNFFDVPPTNTSINSSATREYLTLNPLTDTPYHFKIPASTSYIDLSKCYISTEMRIKKFNAAGALVNLEEADNVAPINNIGLSFIKNIKIKLNDREVYDGNSLFAYKTYIATELTYPEHVKKSYLNASGYYLDGNDQDAAANVGFTERKNLFALSKSAHFYANIDADLFNSDLYLINNVELSIEILPNDDKFMLMAHGHDNTRFHLEILSCKIYIKTLELMDQLALDIAKRLERTPARYALRKSVIKSIFINQGRTEMDALLFSDQVPRRIVLGMIENEAYVGALGKSPFNFKPFNVREVSITSQGHQYPNARYDLDFPNDKCMRAFHDMNEGVGVANSLESNAITYKKYKSGWTFFVFNLTNAQEDGVYFDLIKNGSTNLNIKFSEAVPAGGIVLIAHGELDSLLMLDKNRTISSDTTI